MSDWIAFEGQVVPMQWGDSLFTVLPIPDEVHDALVAEGASRVEIELNDHPFNLKLTKSPALDQVYVYVGKRTLAESSIEPGEVVDVRLRKADPDLVEIPDDLERALEAHRLTDAWAERTPGNRRTLIQRIATAKRAETRAKRIAALITELRDASD